MTSESGQGRVPRLLRLKEVAQLTGLDSWRLYEIISKGKGPPHMRVGKTIRIAEDLLVKWIAEQHRSGMVGEERVVCERGPTRTRRRPVGT